MSTHAYHARPMLALAFAVMRGATAETAINFVGGLKTEESQKRSAATRESRRRKNRGRGA